MRIALIAASVILLSAGVASAQTNPRPYIADISPRAVAPGAAGFTLTVRGTGMIDGVSQIYWNGAPLAGTTCIAAASPNMASCTATVPASSVAVPGRAAKITVVNASVTTPLISNMVPLPINVPVRPAFCYEGDSNCPGRRVDVNSNP
jgi:hypothetical protein